MNHDIKNKRKIIMLYTADYKDKQVLYSTYGSARPNWMITSFGLEVDLRNQWWNIKQGDVVIDVGAGYGSYTLSALAAGAALVISFEPTREDFFELAANLVVNNFTSRCWLFNCILGNQVGVMKNFYEKTHSLMVDGDPSEKLVYPLDVIINDNPLPKVDWIKIDVDGMEMDVLKGAKNTLTHYRPAIIVENHVALIPTIDKQVEDFLLSLDYIKTKELKITPNSNENWACWQFKSSKEG